MSIGKLVPFRALWSSCLLLAAAHVHAQLVSSDGSDGTFSPTSSVTIDLRAAVPAAWDSPGLGNGVYDKAKWAVVFKYASVNIPAGVTVTFKNHSANAPIVWLVQGDVNISGNVIVDGEGDRGDGGLSLPGPGGFRGGSAILNSMPVSAGLGPGGGSVSNSGVLAGDGSFGTVGFGSLAGPTYNTAQILPLVGGSGGAGSPAGLYPGRGGGAGGGAILIASSGTITLNGTVSANGGLSIAYSGGSGGAIRLIATAFAGIGTLSAHPINTGGMGRIRVETNTNSWLGNSFPDASFDVPGTTAQIWPASTAPSLRIVQVGGQAAPDDPHASFDFSDVTLANSGPVVVQIYATNVPLTWFVKLRMVPRRGDDLYTTATFVSGNDVASVWQATVNLPNGYAAMMALARAP